MGGVERWPSNGAQSLATAALGTVVYELLAYPKFSTLKGRWRKDEPLEEISLFEMRWGLLMVRTAIAVERTDRKIPGYNRHGSAHRFSDLELSDVMNVRSIDDMKLRSVGDGR